MLTDEGRKFLEKNYIRKYKVNPDGTVDVNENVHIMMTSQNKFPVKFRIVADYFNCAGTKLTSLEGAPSYVGDYFSCSHNELTSLHDVHKHIKEINGWFYCHVNPINNSVLGLFMIKGIKGVFLDNKKVEKILNKYIGQGRSGVISAQQELLDAGLDEYARL